MNKSATLGALGGSSGMNSLSHSGSLSKSHQHIRITNKRDLLEAVRRLSPARRSGLANTQNSPLSTMMAKSGGGSLLGKEGSTNSALMQSGKKLGGSTKRKPLPSAGSEVEEDASVTTLKALEQGVNLHARRYNELKLAADKKQNELEKMLDKLHGLELENKSLRDMQSAKTAEAARIQKLTLECKEIQTSMDQKVMYRQQLNHMHQRLQDNVMKFGTHIKQMEGAMESAKKEYQEVKLLLRQLEQGKTEAVEELHATMKRLEMDRKVRSQELGQRQREAANAKRMEDWRRMREKRKLELQAELRGDLSKEEEEQLIQKLKKREGQSAKLRAASMDRDKKALTLEEAFAQIRQATGVTSLNEMVSKFMGQGASKEALLEEKAAAEAQLADIVRQKKEAQQKFTEMKAQVAQTGVGGMELNREIYDKLDEEILGAKAELKMNRAAAERLEGVLVAVRQGAVGLKQRLDPFKDLLTYEEQVELPKTGIEALDVLLECEAKLLKMLERLEIDEAGAVAAGSPTGGRGSPGQPLSPKDDPSAAASAAAAAAAAAKKAAAQPWTPFQNEDPDMHAFNVRVKTKPVRGKPGPPGVGGSFNDITPRSDAFGETGHLSDGEGNSSDSDSGEVAVLDRSLLKRTSRKRLNMGMARRDAEERRKRAEAGLDDEEDMAGGKKKKGRGMSKAAQAAAARRLTGSPSPKKRDSTAFLTQKPDLL
eukprot:g3336.t1